MAQRISFFFFSVFVAGRPATLQTGQSTVSYEEEDTVSYEEEDTPHMRRGIRCHMRRKDTCCVLPPHGGR
jgi:hypothetical protein